VKNSVVRILFLFFVFTAVFCATLTAQVPEQDSRSGPLQDCPLPGEPLIFDAGTVWNGTFLSHVFVIDNTGTEPYEIADIDEGEGVRIARFTRTIPPGGKGDAVLEVATGRLNGPVRKTARVRFRNPRRPPLELVLTARVRTSVEVAPVNRIQFKNDKGSPLTWHFRVSSPREPDFAIRKVETHTPYLRTEFRLRESGGTSGNVYDLAITLDPETPIGPLPELVRIRTDIPDGYPGEIFITGEIEGPIVVQPERVLFRAPEDGSYLPVRVGLSNRRGAPFKVTAVKPDAPQMKWKIVPSEKGGLTQAVELQWSERALEKLKYGRLVLMTDVAEQPNIEVDYTVFPRVEREGK
jgi:hypothetical protein